MPDLTLTPSEIALLRRLGRGESTFACCEDRGEYQARLDAQTSLRTRGWVDGQSLTELGEFALADVGHG